MSLITTDELREHVETDLAEEALQRVIDANEKEIVRKFGAHTTQVDYVEPGRSDCLFLSRAPSEITEVVERWGDTDTTLSADDYELVANWRRLNRLSTGTNPTSYWGELVKVTYTPADRNDERKLVLVDLCKLELEYTGNVADVVGDVKTTKKELRKARTEVLSRLSTRRIV